MLIEVPLRWLPIPMMRPPRLLDVFTHASTVTAFPTVSSFSERIWVLFLAVMEAFDSFESAPATPKVATFACLPCASPIASRNCVALEGSSSRQ